jgi:hypothetical protein
VKLAPDNKRMKLTNPPRAACGVACPPFGGHPGVSQFIRVFGSVDQAPPRHAGSTNSGTGRRAQSIAPNDASLQSRLVSHEI